METLRDFRTRIGAFHQCSLPSGGSIRTSAGLAQKVTEQGKLKEFYGNTVVFVLPDEVREWICGIRQDLYVNCGTVLAEPLNGRTFHITLHDLVNGASCEKVEENVGQTRQEALNYVAAIRGEKAVIRMRSTYLFNMVNTSMVLGFEPVDEDGCRILMGYYEVFQNVVKLDYPLTPHVTIAYFRPGVLGEEQIAGLQRVIDDVKTMEPVSVELTGEMLEYQEFNSMNSYRGYRMR